MNMMTPGFCSIVQIRMMLDNCLEIVPPDLGNITEVSKHGISPCRFKVFQKCSKVSIETRCLKVWDVFEDWNRKLAPMDMFNGLEEACLKVRSGKNKNGRGDMSSGSFRITRSFKRFCFSLNVLVLLIKF